MTLRVEVTRRRFDKRAQTALDHARARRIISEAKADLEAAKAARNPQDAELYVLALRSLLKVEGATAQSRLSGKCSGAKRSGTTEPNNEIAHVFKNFGDAA